MSRDEVNELTMRTVEAQTAKVRAVPAKRVSTPSYEQAAEFFSEMRREPIYSIRNLPLEGDPFWKFYIGFEEARNKKEHA